MCLLIFYLTKVFMYINMRVFVVSLFCIARNIRMTFLQTRP